MKALCVTPGRKLELRDVSAPTAAPVDHLLVRMEASAINPGDKFFLTQGAAAALPRSGLDVWGASGAGTVISAGGGEASASLVGKRVAVYRSLVSSPATVGLWSEVAVVHARTVCVLPDGSEAADYSGSLVNAITPYAFREQARTEGHTGVVVTAGSSATGLAMLALTLTHDIPLVAIVSDEASKARLEALGATRVVAQSDAAFDAKLQQAVTESSATAVFDGVGGDLVTRILPLLAPRSTVYGYGFLGGDRPLSVSGRVMMTKNLTIKSFSNFASRTVQDPASLTAALSELGRIFAMPHFKTRRGQFFAFVDIEAALAFADPNGGRAILVSAK